MKVFQNLVCATLSATLLTLVAGPALGQDAEAFYKQKGLVRMIEYGGPGSTYARWGEVVARHMQKYIPGKPNIVVETMPGGGGIIEANYLYKSAPQDGTVIAGVSHNLPLQAFLGDKSIVFDPRKFTWLGSVETNTRVCAVLTETGVATVDDLREKEVAVGGTAPGSGQSFLPIVLNNLVGTKFKVINGYRSAEEINLAVNRGEVSGICGNYDTIRKEQKELLDAGKMRFIFSLETHKDPAVDLPLIADFIKGDEDKKLYTFITSPTEMGRPYVAPPGVPRERATALKKAFEQTMADPEFLSDVKKAGFSATVSTGEELADAVARLYATPKPVVEKAVSIMPAGGMAD